MAFPRKKRKMTHGEARQMFDNMYAREEAKREAAAEAFLRTPAGELARQEFNRAALERLRAKKNPKRKAGRVTAGEAAQIFSVMHDPDGKADFHSLRSDDVQYLLDTAKEVGYRAPKGAKGSKARYFYAYLQNRKTMRVRENPKFGKRRKVGLSTGEQHARRIPTTLEINQMASSLGMRAKSLDELIAMYNKHRKMPRDNFIAKIIAEAAKQVAITKGAKVKRT